LNDQRIGVAVWNHQANVARMSEGLQERLIEGNVAVFGARERAIDIEQNQTGHRWILAQLGSDGQIAAVAPAALTWGIIQDKEIT
jgi:hypothetical protein